MSNSRSNLVVYHNCSLGDAIASIPVFNAIRRHYTGSNLILLSALSTHEKSVEPHKVLSAIGTFHEFKYLVGSRLQRTISMFRYLFEVQPETLIYLNEPHSRLHNVLLYVFLRICGIQRVIGLPVIRTDRYLKIDGTNYESVPKYHARKISMVVGAFELSLDDKKIFPDLPTQPCTHTNYNKEKITVGISIGTKYHVNCWPLKNWVILIYYLISKSNCLVRVYGTSVEIQAIRNLLSPANEQICYCDGDSVESACRDLLSEVDFFIAHDTGLVHVAATQNIPTLGIYGSRNLPGIWYPNNKNAVIVQRILPCTGCGRTDDCPRNIECLNIPPEEIYERFLNHSYFSSS